MDIRIVGHRCGRDRIEAAISRLHGYVQEIDPDMYKELRLARKFMSGTGGMFAGMNHMEYVRGREKTGKRKEYSHSIWRDPPEEGEKGKMTPFPNPSHHATASPSPHYHLSTTSPE